MRCNLSQNKHKSPEGEILFFFDSLVEVFQPTEETLWAYAVRDLLYEYLNQPIYPYAHQALRAAKLHTLINFCERSRQLHCLTMYPSDAILTQSEASLERFGDATNSKAIDFYRNPQDRVDFLRNLRQNGKHAQQTLCVSSLDGEVFEGKCLIQRIELDKDTHLLLEMFTPFDVHG